MKTPAHARTTRLAIAALLLTATTARAIELLQPVAFPDDGLESKALGLLVGDRRAYATAASVVFGRKRNGAGEWQPFVWELDGDGNLLSAQPLGTLPGFDAGTALGGCQFANGDRVAAGSVGTPGTPTQRAVLWRQVAGGAWGGPIDLGPDDTTSDPSSLDGKGTDVNVEEIELIIHRVSPDDTMRLSLAGVDETSVHMLDLPVLAGADAAGLGIAFDAAQDTVVGGWTTAADGRRSPSLWRPQDGGYVQLPLRLPKRYAGQANAIAAVAGGFFGVGEVTSALGGTQGIVMEIASDVSGRTRIRRRALLSPLTGARSSSASAPLGIGQPLPGVLGASVDGGGATLPTVWFRTGKRRWDPVAATEMLSTPTLTGVIDLRHSSYGFVGQIAPASGGPAQGALFRRTGTRVPDGVTVLAGDPAGHRSLSDTMKLWHADGRPLAIAAKRDGSARYADLEVSYAVPPYPGWLTVDYRIVATLAAADPGAGGTLEVSVWDRQTLGFMTVATHPLDTGGATLAGSLSGDGARFVDPATGVLRARVAFHAPSSEPIALGLDEATLTVSPSSGW